METVLEAHYDIVCVCNYKGVGGAQLNASLLASRFKLAGHKAKVVYLCDREPDFQPDADFSVILSQKRLTLFSIPRIISGLRNEIKSNGPIVFLGFQPASNVFAVVAGFFSKNARIIASQRNPSAQQSITFRLLDKLAGTLSLYDRIICVSQAVFDSFKAYPQAYRNRLTAIHNGTPVLVPTDLDKGECRASFGMAGNKLVFGCLARLNRQKNLTFAISLLQLHPDAVLYIAGEGPEKANLKQHALNIGVVDRVVFLGTISGEKITMFYKALDVFLMTSLFEGFGRTIVEALSQGVPIVANDIPITREVAGDTAVYAGLQLNEWVSAINVARLNHNTEAAKKRAALFTIDTMVQKYLEVIGTASHTRT
jgi:glycosyltransferase involved in cell wall biosynthesis